MVNNELAAGKTTTDWERSPNPEGSPSKYVKCADGSYLTIGNVTRWFAQEDGLTRKGCIRASTPGVAMPYTVAVYDNLEQARKALDELISVIEAS